MIVERFHQPGDFFSSFLIDVARGFAELRAHGIDVDEGIGGAEALRLNQAFVTTRRLGRPLVVLKAAAGLDARVAAAKGKRTAISSAGANVKSQLLRASVDAIAVGSETVLVDDPLLTARGCCRVRPLVRVVFDRRLRVPPSARMLSTLDEGPVVVVTRRLDQHPQISPRPGSRHWRNRPSTA